MKQVFTLSYWKSQRMLLLAFLLVHVIIASIQVSHESLTNDEPDYYTYAARWLHGNVERTKKIYDSKSPIVAPALLPRIIQQALHPGYNATDNGISDIKSGRYLMVIFTIIIALYLFAWIRKLAGSKAWIIPMLFFLFDPLVITYSMIITSDMACGACMIATLFHLHRFYETRSWKQFLLFAAWLGVGLVCKASLLFLLPCLLLLYIILLLAKKVMFNFKKLLKYGAVMAVISLLVINLAYFGKGSFHALKQIPLESKSFQSLAQKPVLNAIPLPLPENYIAGLDLLQYHAELGGGTPESSYPGVSLSGETRYKSGFWYYYLYVGVYKIPIVTLAVFFAGFITLIVSFRRSAFFKKHIWYVWPAVFFFILLSFFNPLQLGFRHVLLIYPLLFIGAAVGLAFWKTRWKFTQPLAWVFFIFLVFSVDQYFPSLLAYTNEFIQDKKNVFRKMNDSNIDYGQNTADLATYLQQNPGTQIPDALPKPGRYAIRCRQLTPQHWLYHYQPIAQYKYSIFIFNISEQDINNLK